MDIIAQEFKTPGNIGALARVMKNFEFNSLVLLNPKCNHLDKESLDRATHAKEILKNAKIIRNLDDYDTLIGTTSILGTDYNLQRNPITPEQLSKIQFKNKVGLIIGREGDGMFNTELEKCDIIVTIPTSKKYPTMNVSHATTIILYEIFKNSNKPKLGDHIKPATKDDKERIFKLLSNTLNKMVFINEHKKETQKQVWKKLIGKSNLTKRELMVLYGFLRKIK